LEELLRSAEDYDGAAGASTDAEEWFRGESESLLHWVKKRGRFLPDRLHIETLGSRRLAETALQG